MGAFCCGNLPALCGDKSSTAAKPIMWGISMSDVIDFLERMGRDAHLRHAPPAEVEVALCSEEVAPAVRTAILAKDPAQLEALLGQVPLCVVLLPGQEEEEGDETEETPSQEPDEVPGHSGLLAVAALV